MKSMTKLFMPLLFVAVIMTAGCVSASNPVDLLWPTPRDHSTDVVLGDDAPKASIAKWHTLADTKAEMAAVDAKINVWIAKGELAKKNSAKVAEAGDTASAGIYAGALAAMGAAGLMTPKPGTKAKIVAAAKDDPSNASNHA